MTLHKSLLLLCLPIIACSEGGVTYDNCRYDDQGDLCLKDSLIIELPTSVSAHPDYISLYKEDHNEYILFLSDEGDSIYSYDLTNNLSLGLTKIPSSIPPTQGFCILNDRQIYYNYHSGQLSIIRDNRESFIMAAPPDTKVDQFNPYPFASTIAPIKYYAGNIIMSGFRVGESRLEKRRPRYSICIVDEDINSINVLIEFPDIYKKGNWGGGFTYRQPFFDIGDKGQIVVSFSASDAIIEYSMNTGHTRSVEVGSKYINTIKPFSTSKRRLPDSHEEIVWYRNNPAYQAIIYDSYSHLYYRFVTLPEQNNVRQYSGYSRKKLSVIVLDESLNRLCETPLPDDIIFRPDCVFVSSYGLSIQVFSESEDEIKFYNYVYRNKT